MNGSTPPPSHSHGHAFTFLNGRAREGVTVFSRRSMLKASLAGFAGLSLPNLLRLRAESVAAKQPLTKSKAVILLWMTGGPSHIAWFLPLLGERAEVGRATILIFRGP